MWLIACVQPPIVQENKGDKCLSCTDRELCCASLCLLQHGCKRQTALTHNKISLWCSFHPSRWSVPLSSFLPLFLCRFCFALMMKGEANEWILFWSEGLQRAKRRRESWKTCKDLSPYVCWTTRKGCLGKQTHSWCAETLLLHQSTFWPRIGVLNDFWYACFHRLGLLGFCQVSFKSLQKCLNSSRFTYARDFTSKSLFSKVFREGFTELYLHQACLV